MFKDLITIIIPIFNVKEYLSRCLDSVMGQTYTNLEIILSDDGSTDGSSELCDAFKRRDDRIVVVHDKNSGLSEARNRGIRIAKGKYLCFVDSDDWIDKDYVLKLYYSLIKTSSDIAECNFLRASELGQKGNITGQISVFTPEQMLLKLVKNNHERHVVAWNKLYKRELFNGVEFPLGKLHEDEFTTHLLFLKCKKICLICDELYYYFQNPNSIMSKQVSIARLDALDAIHNRLIILRDMQFEAHVSFCSLLLFKQFIVYSLIKKANINDYDSFYKRLKDKFKSFKKDIILRNFSLDYKFTFILCRINFSFIKSFRLISKTLNIFRSLYSLFKRLIGFCLSPLNNKQKRIFVKTIKTFYKNTNPLKRNALLLSCVEYCNYGDLAIGEATKQFLCGTFNILEINQHDTKKYIDIIKKYSYKDDLIVLPGGGNMSDVWKFDENLRRIIISAFNNNQIVIFPQSYGYKEQGNYHNEGIGIYNSHKNLTIFARDLVSLKKFKSFYTSCEIILSPDVVSFYKTDFKSEKNIDVGLCFRDDKETDSETLQSLIHIILLVKQSKFSFGFLSTVEDKNVPLKNRKMEIEKKIREISQYKLIITDRLHCMMFALLSKTNCILLNNNNSKIKNYFDTWSINGDTAMITRMNQISEEMLNNGVLVSKPIEMATNTNLEDYIVKNAKI